MGKGGFVDGIVFHQLLQLHSMLSAKYPIRGVEGQELAVNLEINMFWDGLFFTGTFLLVALGVALLWHTMKQPGTVLSTRTFLGAMLFGWGVFNLVEGIIDHHILHLHHVIETENHLVWDLVFLGSGGLLIALGWGLMCRGREDYPRKDRPDTQPVAG